MTLERNKMSFFDFKPLQNLQYPTLSPSKRVFRLVQLLPSIPSIIPGIHGTIRIKLIEADIDSDRHYDALSYAWDIGPRHSEPNRQVIVETDSGSYKLSIYPALETALLHLVSLGMTEYIFIDQISINQKDPNEKSHQVLLMQDIYTRCARTIVWLGAATRESDQYFDLVDEISQHGILSGLMGPRVGQFMHVFDAVMDPSLPVNEEEREDRDDLLNLIRQYGDRFPLRGFADVLDRNWFNRLWVIQEACLAPSVVFVCGSKSLCSDCFRGGVLFYNLYNTHWVRNLTKAVSPHELRQRDALFYKTGGLNRIVTERRAIHQRKIRLGLQDLILKYNVNEDKKKIGATLQQDRIFGLLGLTADNDILRQQVQVDYNGKIAQIYTDIAALLLSESTDILLFNQLPKKTNGLPSWAPDWAMDLSIPVGYAALNEPIFTAGISRTTDAVVVKEDLPQLHIKGVFVDRIEEVGTQLHHTQLNPQVMEQIDYRSAKMFFDEVSDFVRAAITTTKGECDSDSDNKAAAGPQLRLCDSGLSYKHFTQNLGTTAGHERLKALHASIYTLGARLIRSDETIASYHITRIYRTIGIVPWYWQPMSEMDSLRTCALDPILAVKIACEAVKDFITDMAGLCIHSARVWFASKYILIRRRFAKLNPRPPLEKAEKLGLDPDISLGPDMNIFTSNMLKNLNRKLYRTTAGYVGLGPADMEPTDSIVVFHGGTTPHVLRKLNDQLEGARYRYLGEAFCDGIMYGEIFEDKSKGEETFVLV